MCNALPTGATSGGPNFVSLENLGVTLVRNPTFLTRLLFWALIVMAPAAATTVTPTECQASQIHLVSQKITASDGAPLDQFGVGVAIDGNVAIVGANHPHPIDPIAGKAYLFDAATSQELHALLPLDGGPEDQFGVSVAISGNLAIVGAPLNDNPNGASAGAAYVFDVTTGNQVYKLTAPDGAAGDHFGADVAINGNLALVGSRFNDGAGVDAGAAYVFDLTLGTLQRKITASVPVALDRFGDAVAIEGDRAIIGAFMNDDAGSDAGAVYLYERNLGGVDNWGQVAQVLPPPASDGDQFGESLAMSGNRAIIGAPFDDDIAVDAGAAYVLNLSTLQLDQKLTASDGADLDQFGEDLAISADWAIVGARLHSGIAPGDGQAYLLHLGTGSEVRRLRAFDGAAADQFGITVGISGSKFIVGSHLDDDVGNAAGAAYLGIVPEPATLTLSAVGLALLGICGRRRCKRYASLRT